LKIKSIFDILLHDEKQVSKDLKNKMQILIV